MVSRSPHSYIHTQHNLVTCTIFLLGTYIFNNWHRKFAAFKLKFNLILKFEYSVELRSLFYNVHTTPRMQNLQVHTCYIITYFDFGHNLQCAKAKSLICQIMEPNILVYLCALATFIWGRIVQLWNQHLFLHKWAWNELMEHSHHEQVVKELNA